MVRRSHLAALSLMFCTAAGSPAAETYDLLPADALGGVACRSIGDLLKKSEKLIKDVAIELPVQPRELCKQALGFLGINAGLDAKAGCALVLANPKHVDGGGLGLRNFDRLIVVAVPFIDLDVMAGNFGFAKGKLKPETMTALDGQRDFGKFCYVRGKHIYLGINDKAIVSVAKGKSVGTELDAARRKSLAEADCLGHLGTEALGDMWKGGLLGLDGADAFDRFQDEAERKTARELVQSLAAVRHVFCTCKLDGGFGCGCLCLFKKDHAGAKKVLTALRGGEGGSSLRGLPDGNVVAATAIHGDGSKNGHIMRVLMHLLLRDLLEANRIFGAGDRPAVRAVFNEVWPRLRGSRFALYKTDAERKLGLFSAVGVVDVDDPQRFLRELKTLAKFGSAEGLDLTSEAGKEKTAAELEQLVKNLGDRRFRLRESATMKLLLAGEQVLPYLEKGIKSTDLETKRRAERIKGEIVQAAKERRKELLSGDLTRAIKPSFVFLDKPEKVEGIEVIQVGVKLAKRDAATAPHLRQLLGPEWGRVRIAVQGKQVVFLAGSNVKLLGETLRNLKEGKPGLAAAAALGEQAKKIDPGRKIELHASVAMGIALTTAADLAQPGKVPAKPPLTTAALTVEEDRLQCDFWMPLAELKAIVKAMQQPRTEPPSKPVDK